MEPSRPLSIDTIATTLAAAGVESAAWDARQLVAHALGGNTAPSAADLARLAALVEQRAQRVPLQLLLGDTGFRLITVACTPGVFIPRPETEVLVELVLAEAATLVAPRIIEPCTGTGAIAASLVAELDVATVCATDINHDAVELARHNIAQVVAGKAGVAQRPDTVTAQVLHGSLCEPVDPSWQANTDVIVCNPPYLPQAVHSELPPEVRVHDPYEALVGGVDGHELVSAVFNAAAAWLRPGGLVAVEIDATRSDDACARAHAAGLRAIETQPDLTGARRFVTARRAL